MANQLYDKGRERFAKALLDWSDNATTTIKCVLVDTGVYTVNAASHEYYSVIAGISGAVIAGPVTMTTRTATAGACDADDVTFTSVTGVTAEALVIYKDTGDTATSPLIAYLDSATGLPITPNGGDIIVTWDNGTNKIFKL